MVQSGITVKLFWLPAEYRALFAKCDGAFIFTDCPQAVGDFHFTLTLPGTPAPRSFVGVRVGGCAQQYVEICARHGGRLVQFCAAYEMVRGSVEELEMTIEEVLNGYYQ